MTLISWMAICINSREAAQGKKVVRIKLTLRMIIEIRITKSIKIIFIKGIMRYILCWLLAQQSLHFYSFLLGAALGPKR